MNKTQLKRNASCATCRYYRDQDQSMGACHRYPPIFAGDQSPRELHRWRFPLVSSSAWCGEFEASTLEEMPAAPADDS